jgi:hypothetical protein
MYVCCLKNEQLSKIWMSKLWMTNQQSVFESCLLAEYDFELKFEGRKELVDQFHFSFLILRQCGTQFEILIRLHAGYNRIYIRFESQPRNG